MDQVLVEDMMDMSVKEQAQLHLQVMEYHIINVQHQYMVQNIYCFMD